MASTGETRREYRKRMRAQGFRPIEIWVPDVRSPEFRAEARRQSLAVANSPSDAEDQAFIDAISEGWDADESGCTQAVDP